MQPRQRLIFSGPEPIFGVCEALGRDFRVNPMLFRAAFGIGLIWNLGIALGVYAALAVIVLVSRLLFPDLQTQIAEPADLTATAPALTAEHDSQEPRAYARAA